MDDPGSPTPCRPQHTQGQVLDSPLGLGREAGTKKFGPTTGSQEEEEVLGLYSPKWEPGGEDMQETQVSDREDTEAGDADPLIIKEEDEKYETQGEAQEE